MNLTAFFSYIFLAAFTPGPNNIMAMSNSARVGFRRGFVFCLGVLAGMLIDMTLCAVFTSMLFEYIPKIAPVMKWVGALYILFLAYTIFRDKPPSGEEGGNGREKRYVDPGSFSTGVVMQFVNIKVILYGITALSTFVLPHSRSPLHVATAVLVLSLTGFAGTCNWALFGSLFQNIFNAHKKLANAIMALLLVYCAIVSLL